MVVEALVATLVGVAALWLVLQPLLYPQSVRAPAYEPIDLEETPKGIALTALKEIEFDRETGKLSDADYESLKAKYTTAAVEALRAEQGDVSPDVEALIADRVHSIRSPTSPRPAACGHCGPRPEVDAVFCSSCGRSLAVGVHCDRCGATLVPGSRFCEGCGRAVAA